MKFAILGHLIDNNDINNLPKEWIHKKYIYSQEFNINGTKGYITGLKLTAKQIMNLPRDKIRNIILDACIFIQNEFNVDLIQLGALTTSVTSGGKWLIDQKKFEGYFNHGDSYTATVVYQTVFKILEQQQINSEECSLSIVGAYGIIGEALAKKLVPKFEKSILIGRRNSKLEELKLKLNGNFEITNELKTKNCDIVITATSHPTALLKSTNLKKNAIIIDVSQPPNLSYDVCRQRNDIIRVDGGFVDIPEYCPQIIPALPKGKVFSCVAEVIMQAMEEERKNHVGAIDLVHLKKTENWAEKYGFILKTLTNYGTNIK